MTAVINCNCWRVGLKELVCRGGIIAVGSRNGRTRDEPITNEEKETEGGK
jgi:hypothetical protein